MRATPRVQLRVTKNNMTGMFPKVSEKVRSEGESINKKSELLATSEG